MFAVIYFDAIWSIRECSGNRAALRPLECPHISGSSPPELDHLVLRGGQCQGEKIELKGRGQEE